MSENDMYTQNYRLTPMYICTPNDMFKPNYVYMHTKE